MNERTRPYTIRVRQTVVFHDELDVQALSRREACKLAVEDFQCDWSKCAVLGTTAAAGADQHHEAEHTPGTTDPADIRCALERVLDYLWNDEAAHCLETSPLEGREEHIFHDLVEIRRWLDVQGRTVARSEPGRNAS